jgi:hypothetical protein
MGLSPDVVHAHIDHWKRHLGKGNRPHRRNWPARLFRHEPLENAVRILQSGVLLSRNDAATAIKRDIAPADIITSRAAAHGSARLYFRPKSPTQYHIEGIRKPNELYQSRQAPVLIMMLFQAEAILTHPNVEFSDGNMQSRRTRTGNTEADFRSLPFNLIYHDGNFDPHSAEGEDIVRRRCAEVLLPSPLQLSKNLQAVLCRSPAERATLLHLLGDSADQWSDKVKVFTRPGLFENRYAYLNTVDGGPDGVAFTLHPRRDGASVTTALWVWDGNGDQRVHFGPTELDPAKRQILRQSLEPGTYLSRLELESCLAYEAPFMIDELPF